MTVAPGTGHTVTIDGETVIRGKADRVGLWHLWHVPTEKLGLRVGPGDGTSVITIDDLEIHWTAKDAAVRSASATRAKATP
jgi:hypothetical protein